MKKNITYFLVCVAVIILMTGFVTEQTKCETTSNQLSGKCGESAEWEYNSTSDTLTIKGYGKINSINNGNVKAKAKKLVIGDEITIIGNEAFKNYNISEVQIGKNVNKIEQRAFYECKNLSNIIVPRNVNYLGSGCFSNITNLKKVTIMGSVKTSGEKGGVFNINTPECIEIAGKFDDMALTYALEESGMPEIKLINGNDYYTYSNGMILSKDKKTLVLYQGNRNVLNIPKTVTKIGKYACSRRNIKSLKFDNALKIIDDYAFYNNALSKLALSKNIQKIGASAFDKNNITNISFNKKIKSIGKNAFSNCEIKKVKLYNNPAIKEGAFDKKVKISYLGKSKKRGSAFFAKCIINQKTGLKYIQLDVNHIMGVDGYQVKIEQPKQKKTIKFNTVGRKALRKTNLKIKYDVNDYGQTKIKSNYVMYAKIRPYIVKNSKKKYGIWSVRYKLNTYPDFGFNNKKDIK